MSTLILEPVLLENLILNEPFTRKVLPFIDKEYFAEQENKHIFELLNNYFRKNNRLPDHTILKIESNELSVDSKILMIVNEKIDEIFSNNNLVADINWLMSQAEQWCRERSLYNNIIKAISIYDGSEQKLTANAIPDLMRESLAITFDTSVGVDWADQVVERFEKYNTPQDRIPFVLETLNDITAGGVTRKTLSIVLGGVHTGKTLFLVHLAADYCRVGKNVLYVSMEMSEFDILQRVDANMLKMDMLSLKDLNKDAFIGKINTLKQKSYGRLKVIQFPTSEAHVGHFTNLLDELNIKQRFVPDVIVIDYLGITASAKIKPGTANSFTYLKSVSEELRALAVNKNVAIWSAMQLNRSGFTDSDAGMENISESFGITHTADLMLSIYRNEELDADESVCVKQLKNRFNSVAFRRKFLLGVNLMQQYLYDKSDEENAMLNEPIAAKDVDYKTVKQKFDGNFKKKFSNTTNFADVDFSSDYD